MAWDRIIGHVDMDAFYVSVEVRDDPSLAGLPLAVGGSADRRGVIASASYEARRFGVRSAMPAGQALKLCPDLLLIPGNMAKYQTASRVLGRVFREFTPLVEPLSLDEAFLDLTGSQRLFGAPRAIGERIRARIREELDLTASVGLAASKFVAKLASDHDKPDGLTIVTPGDTRAFLESLPLARLWGVGPSTHHALERAGIRTMRALAAADPEWLSRAVGFDAHRLVDLANGRDSRAVVPGHEAKSISHETTFARDVGDADALEGVLARLAGQVARRARRHGVAGRTVSLKLRLPDFTTLTRRRTLPSPTCDTTEILETARALFRAIDRRGRPVRLLGVGIANLLAAPQLALDLFGDPGHEAGLGAERIRRLEDAEDAIADRFGGRAVARGRALLADRTRDTGSWPGRPRLGDEPPREETAGGS
jgi:DNA polymerase-4